MTKARCQRFSIFRPRGYASTRHSTKIVNSKATSAALIFVGCFAIDWASFRSRGSPTSLRKAYNALMSNSSRDCQTSFRACATSCTYNEVSVLGTRGPFLSCRCRISKPRLLLPLDGRLRRSRLWRGRWSQAWLSLLSPVVALTSASAADVRHGPRRAVGLQLRAVVFPACDPCATTNRFAQRGGLLLALYCLYALLRSATLSSARRYQSAVYKTSFLRQRVTLGPRCAVKRKPRAPWASG